MERKMVEENQDSLERKLHDLSANFNHQEKAYAILTRAAEKGYLPEIERQLAIKREGVGNKVLSIQLLVDYQRWFDFNQVLPNNNGRLASTDLRYLNTDGRVKPCPSLDDYDEWYQFL